MSTYDQWKATEPEAGWPHEFSVFGHCAGCGSLRILQEIYCEPCSTDPAPGPPDSTEDDAD